MDWDALLLSRLQFAFTVSFHIIFPSFTIGLASYLAVLEGLWLKTGNEVFRNLYLFWKGELHDFELHLEFKVTGGPSANSGIQFRCQKEPGRCRW